MMELVGAVAVQSNVKMVDVTKSVEEIKRVEKENLDRVCELIRFGASEAGPGSKLVVLPESFLHSFPRATNPKIVDLIPMCIQIPGEETETLGKLATEYNAYICGAAYEFLEEWPGRVWNTAFIVDPNGKLILKSHKTLCETGTNPGSVLEEYIRRYGEKALFPVVDTKIGKLGAFICAEGLFRVEVARCLALNGAEILCYPISTTQSDFDYYHLVARAHAWFNQCYLVSANLGLTFSRYRAQAQGGSSLIVDYEGRILRMARTVDEATIRANLDIEALRQYRMTNGFMTTGTAFDPQIYLPYKRQYKHPDLRGPEKPVERYGEVWAGFGRGVGKERTMKNLEYLYSQNLLVPPSTYTRREKPIGT